MGGKSEALIIINIITRHHRESKRLLYHAENLEE
jgi:hypothetical protein